MSRLAILLCGLLCAGTASAQMSKPAGDHIVMIAKLLQRTAQACLHDTRDRGLGYENAPNCLALDRASRSYYEVESAFLDAGQLPPREARIEHARARAAAWTARATSLAGDTRTSLH